MKITSMRYVNSIGMMGIAIIGLFHREMHLPSIVGPVSALVVAAIFGHVYRSRQIVSRQSQQIYRYVSILAIQFPSLIFIIYMMIDGRSTEIDIELSYKI